MTVLNENFSPKVISNQYQVHVFSESKVTLIFRALVELSVLLRSQIVSFNELFEFFKRENDTHQN